MNDPDLLVEVVEVVFVVGGGCGGFRKKRNLNLRALHIQKYPLSAEKFFLMFFSRR